MVSFGTDYGGGGGDILGGRAFFWDERAATVGDQSLGSMTNPREMDMTMDQIVANVQSQAFYPPLFKAAFGDEKVDQSRIFSAITAFVNVLGVFNTKFDQEAESHFNAHNSINFLTDFNGFTAQIRGKLIFQNNCASCHGSIAARSTVEMANNGLDLNYTDEGVGGISKVPELIGVFKVPSLRNIALTAPYMHDGRFKTLRDVVNHYNSGIKNHPNLHSNLRDAGTGLPKTMNFTESDKDALIAFLNTLTDAQTLAAEKFADPFK